MGTPGGIVSHTRESGKETGHMGPEHSEGSQRVCSSSISMSQASLVSPTEGGFEGSTAICLGHAVCVDTRTDARAVRYNTNNSHERGNIVPPALPELPELCLCHNILIINHLHLWLLKLQGFRIYYTVFINKLCKNDVTYYKKNSILHFYKQLVYVRLSAIYYTFC